MKMFALILFVAVAVQAAAADNGFQDISPNVEFKIPFDDASFEDINTNLMPRISGGEETSPEQFPYQVVIMLDHKSFCSGSLIHPRWVLTTAHCVKNYKTFEVYLGVHKINPLEKYSDRINATHKITHSLFNDVNLTNDIALLRLSRMAKLNNYVRPIRLPRRSEFEELLEGQAVIASGWGKISNDTVVLSDVLRQVQLEVLQNSKCEQVFRMKLGRGRLCAAGYDLNDGTCLGDNGGPLVEGEFDVYGGVDPTLIGITSFLSSRNCGSGAPSVFIRVASYLDWISANTGINIS